MSTTALPDVDVRNAYAASLRRAARSFTAPVPPESMAASKAWEEPGMDAVERLHPELFASQRIGLLWSEDAIDPLAGLPAYDVEAADQALAREERAVIQGQQVVELAKFRHRRRVSVN